MHHTGRIERGSSGYSVSHPDGGGMSLTVEIWSCCSRASKDGGCQTGDPKHHPREGPFYLESWGDEFVNGGGSWGCKVAERSNFKYACCGQLRGSPGCCAGYHKDTAYRLERELKEAEKAKRKSWQERENTVAMCLVGLVCITTIAGIILDIVSAKV